MTPLNEKVVFDSSAVIALFAKEKGYELITKYLKNAIISTVNLAEIYKYCIDQKDLSKEDCQEIIAMSGIKVIDFDNEQALISAAIYPKTKAFGLSLGDRACIALAINKDNLKVITCDKIWQDIQVDIHFIMAR